MRLAPVALALLIAAAARPAAAQLQMLNFDDIPNSPGSTVYVPDVYHGYTFGGGSGPCDVPGQCSWVTNRGVWAGTFPLNVSDPVSAWSSGGQVLTLSRATPFTFASAYLGGRYGQCPTAPTATITGSLGGALVHTMDVNLTCGAFQLVDFNWTGVDAIQFANSGLTDGNMTLDDITVSTSASTTTPEPATVGLLALGMVALGAAARRRQPVS